MSAVIDLSLWAFLQAVKANCFNVICASLKASSAKLSGTCQVLLHGNFSPSSIGKEDLLLSALIFMASGHNWCIEVLEAEIEERRQSHAMVEVTAVSYHNITILVQRVWPSLIFGRVERRSRDCVINLVGTSFKTMSHSCIPHDHRRMLTLFMTVYHTVHNDDAKPNHLENVQCYCI